MQVITRNELLAAIMQLIIQSPQADLMVVIDTDATPTILQTNASHIWSFGLLSAAETTLAAEYELANAAGGVDGQHKKMEAVKAS